MPFEINILYGEENNKMVFFQDQTLSDLRIKL